ncbi:hypothetical protein BS50DRAFT_633229 [Corynespora cassiicola Philippines]|uniref:Rhodopsin domain-containing protein n=1 Tax=Corynespora cassiicola Philippines TaxID=1448308 RepID=A0A2T2NVM0_CORCC|nr:hypothetical protein BS50DRAFT_633229 [Corynespora cassiicola Philippines]
MIPLRWWQAQSALIVFLDIYIFLLLLPAIAKIQLGVRQKLATISLLSLALMRVGKPDQGIGASIASLVMRVRITETSDMTWISTILFLCSAVEPNITIIMSSGPGFVKFVRSYISNLPSFFSSRQKRSSEGAYPHSDHLERNSDRSAGGAPNPAIRMDHQYYELNETSMLRTGASTNTKDLNSEDNREAR